jgi:hypothetical protein
MSRYTIAYGTSWSRSQHSNMSRYTIAYGTSWSRSQHSNMSRYTIAYGTSWSRSQLSNVCHKRMRTRVILLLPNSTCNTATCLAIRLHTARHDPDRNSAMFATSACALGLSYCYRTALLGNTATCLAIRSHTARHDPDRNSAMFATSACALGLSYCYRTAHNFTFNFPVFCLFLFLSSFLVLVFSPFPIVASSFLHICMIWGFPGGDYEECRLLGYENPVRASEVTSPL